MPSSRAAELRLPSARLMAASMSTVSTSSRLMRFPPPPTGQDSCRHVDSVVDTGHRPHLGLARSPATSRRDRDHRGQELSLQRSDRDLTRRPNSHPHRPSRQPYAGSNPSAFSDRPIPGSFEPPLTSYLSDDLLEDGCGALFEPVDDRFRRKRPATACGRPLTAMIDRFHAAQLTVRFRHAHQEARQVHSDPELTFALRHSSPQSRHRLVAGDPSANLPGVITALDLNLLFAPSYACASVPTRARQHTEVNIARRCCWPAHRPRSSGAVGDGVGA